MTTLQVTRQRAKAVEASRSEAYHNKVKTRVIGLRVSVEVAEAWEVAWANSPQNGDGGLGPYLADVLIKVLLDRKQGPQDR
jgi:hypothetical protein